MRTFNFGECSVCENLKHRKEDILNYKFDSNITNNIVSFLGCNSCRIMKTYEDIYSDENFDKLSKIQKQIHCLFSFFDNDYKKLKNLKEKKKFLKEIIDRSDCSIKSLVKKFLSDRQNIYMVEMYKKLFLKNKLGYFYYIYSEEFERDVITFRTQSEDLIFVFSTLLKCYLDHLMGFYRKKYFNINEIHLYIMSY